MGIMTQLLVFSFSIFIFLTIPAQSAISCKPDSCHSKLGLSVKFPFRLKDRQPARCGYPGFDLYCNSRNQTILNLPQSGEFIVDHIDYSQSYLYINDPGSCLPNRALNFSLSGSPFWAPFSTNFTYLNCTTPFDGVYVPLRCLSDRNTKVLAVPSRWQAAAKPPPTCRKVADVSVPLQWCNWMFFMLFKDLDDDFQLAWREPKCGECEEYRGICGFKNDSGLEIGCTGPSSISTTARDVMIIVVLILGLHGLVFCFLICVFNIGTRCSSYMISTTVVPTNQQPLINEPVTALYSPDPKMMAGESRGMPKPSNDKCPICLCKNRCRSVSKCNHRFHSGCLNEWLKLKGTCPLCRTSLKGSSMDKSCSSTSLSSSSSSTTLDLS